MGEDRLHEYDDGFNGQWSAVGDEAGFGDAERADARHRSEEHGDAEL
jgi:hypothetical protein